MINREFPPVLDGHEDFITAIPNQDRDFLIESERGHVDLPRAQRGCLGGTFVSIWLSDGRAEQNAAGYAMQELNDWLRICDRSVEIGAGDTPLALDHAGAAPATAGAGIGDPPPAPRAGGASPVTSKPGSAGTRSEGAVRTVRTSAELDKALDEGAFAGIIHFEGADPISYSLKELRVFYEAGLRSLGLVWSRPTIFGYGVMFRDPPPMGGLTDAGFALVAECNRLGILLDVSHLNPAGFWDLHRLTDKPFVATHSSVKAISPHVRNLDDDQIRAIAEKDGAIGINFANSFLRPDTGRGDDTPLDLVVSHFEHIINLVGDRHVAIGSDYDGTDVPRELTDSAHLPVLLRAFQSRGWSDDRIERICNGNFRRVVRAVWR